tara:strand:- start:668 stop:1042 length:375 start_codon:yes stop_codon:yes gene_type:complete
MKLDRKISYLKRNPLAYALALEGDGLSDEDIKKGLEEIGLYNTKQIEFSMRCMISSRSNTEKEYEQLIEDVGNIISKSETDVFNVIDNYNKNNPNDEKINTADMYHFFTELKSKLEIMFEINDN